MTQFPAGGGQPYEGASPADRVDPASGYPQYGLPPQQGNEPPTPSDDPVWGYLPGYQSGQPYGLPPGQPYGGDSPYGGAPQYGGNPSWEGNPQYPADPQYPANPQYGMYPPAQPGSYPTDLEYGADPGYGASPQYEQAYPPQPYGAQPRYGTGQEYEAPSLAAPPRRHGRVLGAVAVVTVLLLVLVGGGTAAWFALKGEDSATPTSLPVAAKCVSGTVGVLGDTGGDPDELGEAALAVAQLAADEYHAAHPDCTVAIRAFDSGGEQEKAVLLAKKIAADDTVLAVLGPLFSKEAVAASPVLDKAGVPMVNPVASMASLGTTGMKSFHRTVGSDTATGTAMAKYIKTADPKAKVFVVNDGGNYGAATAAAARTALGTLVVDSSTIQQGKTDFSLLASTIKESGATVIAFAGFSKEAAGLRKAVNTAGGSDIDLVAGPGLLDTVYVTEAGEAGKDTVVVCACVPGTGLPEAFRTKVKQKTTTSPSGSTGEMYDAANAVLAGLGAGKRTRTQLNSFLDRYSATGVTGPIAFQPGGDLRGTPPQWYFVVGTDGFLGRSRVQ